MTTQQIIAVGQMEPDGHEDAIRRAVEYVQEHQPDRVIATAGATEGFLERLRAVYDGWIGAHLSTPQLCDAYGVEPLPEQFEFAPGWASYSGQIDSDRLPHCAVLSAARKVNMSFVSGTPPVFQCNTFSIVDESDTRLRSNTGIGVGHLRGGSHAKDGNLGFAHLVTRGSWLEGNLIRILKRKLSFGDLGPIESIPSDVEVDLGPRLRRYEEMLARRAASRPLPIPSAGAGISRSARQSD